MLLMQSAVLGFLTKAESHLKDRKIISPTKNKEDDDIDTNNGTPPVPQQSDIVELRENFLGAPLYQELEEHLNSTYACKHLLNPLP